MPSRSLLPLLLLLLPLGVQAAADLPGIRLYERGNYARASRELKTVLDDPRRSEPERALARVYLAASLLALDKVPEARAQLEVLARSYPAQAVDPALFPPELVELDRTVRGPIEAERLREEAEAAERKRLATEAAERERLATEAAERERLERERQARLPVSGEGKGPGSASPAAAFRLRPEVVGFGDVSGWVRLREEAGPPSFGGAVGLTFGRGWLEGSARALLGAHVALEVEVGAVLGTGVFAPRVALRGTVLPVIEGTRAYGGGVVVGGRLALSSRFTALVDVSGQLFDVPAGYRSVALMGSVGLGFNLL